MPNGSGTIVGHAALPASLAWGSQHRLAARPIALQLQQVLGAIDAAATAAMRASFDLLIMTPLLIGSKQRLAAIVALQGNLDSQRLNTVPTAHFHQHQRALFRCGREPLPRQPEHGAQPNRSRVFVRHEKILNAVGQAAASLRGHNLAISAHAQGLLVQ
jgi:hypothetical protein